MIFFIDEPAELQAYIDASGQPAPKPTDSVQVAQLRNETEKVAANPEGSLMDTQTADQLRAYVEQQAPHYIDYYVGSATQPLNEQAGLFTHQSTAGEAVSLVRHQIVRFLDVLMRARAARGDIAADDPALRRTEAFVGWHKIKPAWDQTQ